jgi:hypothetical protein
MNDRSDQLRHLLLDMLSTRRAPTEERLAALNGWDWATIAALAGEHRLRPMLHWRSKGRDWPLPEPLRMEWQAAFDRSAKRQLARQRQLIQCADLLHTAGMPFALLKGAALAWSAYPHPALRPLRDLDILVPMVTAMDAYQLMQGQGGFRLLDGVTVTAEYALAHSKHLPPLVGPPPASVALEIHVRVTGVASPQGQQSELHQADVLLGRRVYMRIGDRFIPALAPTDMLLHLIVHAAVDHEFNNGPLIFADIAALLHAHEVDWPHFWRMAGDGGWARSARLALELADHFEGPLPIIFPEALAAAPPELRDAAALLTLAQREVSFDQRMDQVMVGHRQRGGLLRYLSRQIVPPRHVVAQFAGVERNAASLPFHYLRRAGHLGGHLLLSLWRRNGRTDAIRLRAVHDWLHDS